MEDFLRLAHMVKGIFQKYLKGRVANVWDVLK
jgi:hypothetical protein